MLLETLSQELLLDARKETDAILADARREVQKIQEKSQEKIDSFRKEQERAYEQEREENDAKARAQSYGEAKKILLQAQQQAITSLREELLAELNDLDNKQKTLLYERLITYAQKFIEPKKIFCQKQDKKLLETITTKPLVTRNSEGLALADDTAQITITFEDLVDDVITKENKKIMRELEGL